MAKAVKQNELAKDLELYIKVGKYSNFASVKKSPRDKVTYVDYLNTSYKKMQNMLDDLQDSYFIEGISGKKIPKFSQLCHLFFLLERLRCYKFELILNDFSMSLNSKL